MDYSPITQNLQKAQCKGVRSQSSLAAQSDDLQNPTVGLALPFTVGKHIKYKPKAANSS